MTKTGTMKWATFSLLNVIVCILPGILLGADLPDLVIKDILVGPGTHKDYVIIATRVKNNGGDAIQKFDVWCHFNCGKGESYFGVGEGVNGLAKAQEITLGGVAELSLSDCPFPPRYLDCRVDPANRVVESDETNNSRTEPIMTVAYTVVPG